MLRYPTEPLPKHPAYDDESHGLRSAIDGSLAKLLEVTSDDICDDTEMKRIHERIDEVYEPRKPPTLKIALVGDAGVGKSSLINSVLHIPGIAKTSAVADSCTAVPTEFKGADQDQNDTYKAVVRYRSRKEIDKFIKCKSVLTGIITSKIARERMSRRSHQCFFKLTLAKPFSLHSSRTDDSLLVFCISNTHYDASCDEDTDQDQTTLSVESSGIPSLRAHALALAADMVRKHYQGYFLVDTVF